MTSVLSLIKRNSLPVSKRTRSSTCNTISQLSENQEYISATEFDNFCENDLISDWFSVVSKKFMIEYKPENNLEFLFKKGNEHEQNVIEKIRQMTGLSLEKHSSVNTSRDYDIVSKSVQKKDLDKTLKSMREGIPIIYSAFICDKKEKLRGIPDLLVRNDYLNTLFKDLSLPDLSEYKDQTYYVPVEIKFSSVELCADNKHILNQGRMKIYKTQLLAYCNILKSMQGIFPSYALIIGKRTIFNSKKEKHIRDSIEYPGLIDYMSNDYSYGYTFAKGVEWLRDVKKNALNWTLEDFKSKEIFPNMKSNNTTFLKDKKKLADQYGEITDLWRCSTNARKNALNQGIYSWKDYRFDSNVASLPYPYRQSLDNILKVNREDIEYYPQKLSDQSFKIIENEMFVDFELVRDSLDTDSIGDQEWLFLIGVRYKGEYTSFFMNSLTADEEKRVVTEFYEFVVKNGSPKCWFWFAEVRFWNKALKRNDLDYKINWIDMYELFTKEGFAVKGSMNFKLKSYIKSLKNLKLIDVQLPPDNCSDGVSAMIIAWKYYEGTDEDKGKYESEMKDCVYYNSLDCEYLDKLLTFARDNL